MQRWTHSAPPRTRITHKDREKIVITSYSIHYTKLYDGLDAVALALASGAAAALSLTTGLSSILVGVMVAVALLPPAAAAGLMIA